MDFVKKNIATIVTGLIVTAVLICAVVMIGPWQSAQSSELTVVVHDANGDVRRLPLNQDAHIDIHTDLGSNTVVISGGSARMEEADCPNGDCTRQLPINKPGQQIICLPHKLWIEVRGSDDKQSAMDVDAVSWADSEQADVDLVAR